MTDSTELKGRDLAALVPSTAIVMQNGDEPRRVCMTYAELKQFAAALAAAPSVPTMADTIHGQELLRWNRSLGERAPIKIGMETAVARKARELLATAPEAPQEDAK